MHRRTILKSLAAAPLAANLHAAQSRSWLGPDYWANPLQDWRWNDGRIECIVAGADRNVFWLTRECKPQGRCEMSVRLGRLGAPKAKGWAGFRFGMRGYFDDYRDTAVRGLGYEAGITSEGRLFIGNAAESSATVGSLDNVLLQLQIEGQTVTLRAGDIQVEASLPGEETGGGVALVCHSGDRAASPPVRDRQPRRPDDGKQDQARKGDMRAWFRDWTMSGDKVAEHPGRAWGPVMFVQYTLSRRVLKLTAQLAPCEGGEPAVELYADGRKISEATPDTFSSTAVFRIENWDDSRDHPFEVAWQGQRYGGTIQRDPRTKASIVAGALTCQWDFGFPHCQIAANLEHLRPDILFFTGDQLYESNGGYGIQRGPIEVARLDYLRKWYLFGWAWGDLTRRTPCVCLADDHDVYHGNLWGAGGRKAEYPATAGQGENPQQTGQDSGGYTMAARWVNMVYRTQSAHLPDAYDREPLDQGIVANYTELVWGGISFALLEDRKFKSAPKALLPEARIVNGWPQNPAWDSAKSGDAAGAQLLGAKQERFLKQWAESWPPGVEMKAAVSATIFCNLATLPKEATNDSVTNKLPVMEKGGYAPDEKLVQDHDSNGWPQTPRNRALRILRSCLAVHIAGDQHLPSTVQYGIDDFDDAAYAICTPAVSNFFPRRWYPANRQITGKWLDGFGNRMTVQAVANPQKIASAHPYVDERVPGFGAVVFDKRARRIQLTNWPRWADLRRKDAAPFPGWPIMITAEDNGLKNARYRLRLRRAVRGVVRVKDAQQEIVLSYRPARPVQSIPVWKPGSYEVSVDGKALGRFEAREA